MRKLVAIRPGVTIPAPNTARAQAYIALLSSIGASETVVLNRLRAAEVNWNLARNKQPTEGIRPKGWLARYGIMEES
jgi:hypothetical protein